MKGLFCSGKEESWMKEKVKDGQTQACCKTWITIIVSLIAVAL